MALLAQLRHPHIVRLLGARLLPPGGLVRWLCGCCPAGVASPHAIHQGKAC